METYAKLCLFSYETRQPLRELTPEEQDMYQAMLDTYSAPEQQYGVVEGKPFGHDGLVYAQRTGSEEYEAVAVTLSTLNARKLRALAQAQGLTVDAYLEQLIERQLLPRTSAAT